jgi:anti-sigma factor RsiW
MNADRANTRSPHLGLEDLIAGVTGQATGDGAREHLATCERCRAEANRWDLVADGVRGLAAAAPEVAQPARPRQAGPQVLAGPRRRTMLAASAAAALVLVGAAGYGAAADLTGHVPHTARTGTTTTTRTGTKATALTAVSGCAGLKQADGTLEQVNGSSLVIKTAGGQSVTVTTKASTMASMARAPLSDITDGATVTVVGHSSDGAIAANRVNVGSPFRQPVSGSMTFRLLPGMAGAYGTASDVTTSGFTVVTSGGTRVPVTTSGSTAVRVFHASLSQLQAGASTIAAGYVGPGGTLSATVVMQPQPGSAGNMHLDLGGCTPASIDQAYTSASVSGG